MRAVNEIQDDGVASLAPSLFRMTQLTSLNLGGTLHASAASCAVSGCFANAGCALMMLRAVGWGGCALGWSGLWVLRGVSRGASGRAGNGSEQLGQASLAPSLAAAMAHAPAAPMA